MNVLIVYATYHGSTEHCAYQLKGKIFNAVTANLNLDEALNLSEFDTIIIGTPIRAGKIHKKVRKFFEKNQDALHHKRLYYFICGLENRPATDFMSEIPAEIQGRILFSENFGAKVDFSSLTGTEKFMLDAAQKEYNFKIDESYQIHENLIDDFAKRILEP